ncbi:MAG: hypothetical protein QOJ16_2476, partial [Acidobacteriota bacterium]|nr:hypothetical protein [Acidobacteriota bacterium]
RDQLLAKRVGYPATFTAAELRTSYQAVLDGILVR